MPQRTEQEAQGDRLRQTLGGAIDTGGPLTRHREKVERPTFVKERDDEAGREIADFVDPNEEDLARKPRQHEADMGLDAAELFAARVHRMEQDEPRHRRAVKPTRTRSTRTRKAGAPTT